MQGYQLHCALQSVGIKEQIVSYSINCYNVYYSGNTCLALKVLLEALREMSQLLVAQVATQNIITYYQVLKGTLNFIISIISLQNVLSILCRLLGNKYKVIYVNVVICSRCWALFCIIMLTVLTYLHFTLQLVSFNYVTINYVTYCQKVILKFERSLIIFVARKKQMFRHGCLSFLSKITQIIGKMKKQQQLYLFTNKLNFFK